MVFNPLDFNKGLFDQVEKIIAEFFEKRMRDPEFMQIFNKGMALSLEAKTALDARVEELLKAMNLATRKDLEAIFTTLNGLETRVIDLEDKVQAACDLARSPMSSPVPARARPKAARGGSKPAPRSKPRPAPAGRKRR